MLESLSKEDSGFLFEDLGRFDTPVEMCLKEHSQTAPNVQIRNGVGMTILGMSSVVLESFQRSDAEQEDTAGD